MEFKIENHADGVTEFIVREGKALDPLPFRPVNVAGIISSPLEFIMCRRELFFSSAYWVDATHLIFDYENGKITLNVNEHEHPVITVTGKLEQSKKNDVIFVNDVSTIQLSDIVKMNRHLFESPATAMNLVTVLRNFKAKVEKEIENFKDDKGNFAIKRAQIVDSNCPAGFTVYLEPFKGEDKMPFLCEILIDANLNCTVISPEYNEYIEANRKRLLDEQYNAIREILPTIVIIKQ